MKTGSRPAHPDAIVIGSNLAGLVIAHALSSVGYRTVVADGSTEVGGMDRSFTNENGRVFDFGFHGLAYMRSELVTRLFVSVMDGAVRHLEHRRGIVLRGYTIPYNAAPERWPAEIAALLRRGPRIDDIGASLPTRERIAAVYGEGFAGLIFDEVLPSYPSEARHAVFGVDPAALLVNIYPWFFPRIERASAGINPSRLYQDSVREGRRESLLYPLAGGFGGFANGFRRLLEARGVEFWLDPDFEVRWNAESQRVDWVGVGGRRARAPRVYWTRSPETLCELLGKPLPALDPDLFVLGSFEFDRPIRCEYTELIVGDPDHPVNRISFPGKLNGERDDLVQLEFAFPRAANGYSTKANDWQGDWLRSLRRLGVIGPEHNVVAFDWKKVPLLYNAYGVEGQPMPEIDLGGLDPATNLRPVLPSLRKINLNTRVPDYLRFVLADLAERPAEAPPQ